MTINIQSDHNSIQNECKGGENGNYHKWTQNTGTGIQNVHKKDRKMTLICRYIKQVQGCEVIKGTPNIAKFVHNRYKD